MQEFGITAIDALGPQRQGGGRAVRGDERQGQHARPGEAQVVPGKARVSIHDLDAVVRVDRDRSLTIDCRTALIEFEGHAVMAAGAGNQYGLAAGIHKGQHGGTGEFCPANQGNGVADPGFGLGRSGSGG